MKEARRRALSRITSYHVQIGFVSPSKVGGAGPFLKEGRGGPTSCGAL